LVLERVVARKEFGSLIFRVVVFSVLGFYNSKFGMVFPLTFVLCRVTFPVLFINSSKLSSLAEPGLGAPLSSYLEGALSKLIDR